MSPLNYMAWYNFDTKGWIVRGPPTTDEEALPLIPRSHRPLYMKKRAEGLDVMKAMIKALEAAVGKISF